MRKGSLVYSLTRGLAKLVFLLMYQVEIEREEPSLPDGPAVILPKHQFWTDIPLVSISFDDPLSFVAKKELFRFPGVRSTLRRLGGIPIDREVSIRTLTSIRDLLFRLKEKEKVVIFPEGTYVRGVVGTGKSRLIQMILGFQSELKQQIPFVPMGIRYGKPKGGRRRVEIRIGHPLFADQESDAASLTAKVMSEISRLSRLPRVQHGNGGKCH
jgi:1-acyl-sn-glycerol-3-phosphate acyltransferase